jgi:hypothetical protein
MLLHAGPLEQKLREWFIPGQKSQEPLTLYQKSLVELADRLNEEAKTGIPSRAGEIQHEHEAAIHVQKSLRRFLGR